MTSTLEKAQSSNPEDWPIFSYSQLQEWDRCQYKWYLGYEEEWTLKEKSTGLNIGSLVHTYLEVYYNARQLGVSNLEAWDLVERCVTIDINEAMDSGASLTEIHRAAFMVKKYVFDFAPTKDAGMLILGVEKHFIVPYQTPKVGLNFYLQGYVDLLYSKKGKITSLDHKTSSNARFWSPDEIAMDPQQTLYLAALRRLGINVYDVEYNFLNSYEYKDKSKATTDKLFRRDPSYRTDIEIENFEYQLLLQIEKLIQATGDDDYSYHRSLRRDCSMCVFKDPCQHGLKGINPQAVLVTKFKKKEKMPAGIRPGTAA